MAMHLSNEALIQSVLEQVNRVLMFFGAEPLSQMPPGACDEPDDCPLSHAFRCDALEIDVHNQSLVMDDLHDAARIAELLGTAHGEKLEMSGGRVFNGLWVIMTREMAEFVRRFDAQMIPELIEASLDPISSSCPPDSINVLDEILVDDGETIAAMEVQLEGSDRIFEPV